MGWKAMRIAWNAWNAWNICGAWNAIAIHAKEGKSIGKISDERLENLRFIANFKNLVLSKRKTEAANCAAKRFKPYKKKLDTTVKIAKTAANKIGAGKLKFQRTCFNLSYFSDRQSSWRGRNHFSRRNGVYDLSKKRKGAADHRRKEALRTAGRTSSRHDRWACWCSE